MLQTITDIQTEFLVRNNRTTTDSFITDTTLKNWTVEAHNWATAYKKWPMTQARASTTFATEETPNFEGWIADSTRFIQVGGYRYQKVSFEDYQIFRETEPQSTKRYFSDFNRTYFINPNSASGSVFAYGQYLPYIDVTDNTATTIFSNYEQEGNDAIIDYMTALLKAREHLTQESLVSMQSAAAKLDRVWNRIGTEQFTYQSISPQGMWKRIDAVEGIYFEDRLKRDQF